MRPRVLVTHPLVAGGLDALAERYEVVQGDGLESEDALRAAVAGVAALIPVCSAPITAGVLAAADQLRVVANCAVGFDNVDVAAATRRGVWVTNTPGVLTEATADLTWAALLALVRRVVEGDALVRAGRFAGFGPTLLLGADLAGKTLGVVGLGQIGRAVARRAVPFGMRVVYADPRSPAAEVDLGLGGPCAAPLALEELLRQADIVTLHVPLDATTRHLLDARRLALLRPTAYLINTSRGPVIDERALVDVLRAGRLGGVALDVYEDEPRLAPGLVEIGTALTAAPPGGVNPPGPPVGTALTAAPPGPVETARVLLLPHLGSATVETRRRMAQLAAANAAAVLEGRAPPSAVNQISSAR